MPQIDRYLQQGYNKEEILFVRRQVGAFLEVYLKYNQTSLQVVVYIKENYYIIILFRLLKTENGQNYDMQNLAVFTMTIMEKF